MDPHIRDSTSSGSKATICTLDTWVNANSDYQALPRSVWQDLTAMQGHCPRVCLLPHIGPGKAIVYPGSLRPYLVEYISVTSLILASERRQSVGLSSRC